jgi:hypothetical protein
MSPERIQQLLQMLWDEVNGSEDLQKFVENYGDELDQDFLAAIAAVVQNAGQQGNANAARFFNRMGQTLLPLVMPSDALRRAAAKTQDARYLVQILLEKINDPQDLDRFAAEYMKDFNGIFFAVLQETAETEKAKGNTGNARFLAEVGQALQQLAAGS